MFAILTLDLGIAPAYVLDEMETYEITALIEHRSHKHREQWEQARFIAFIVAQCNTKKNLKLTDLIKFDWDGKGEGKTDAPTKEEVNRLAEMAKAYEGMFAATTNEKNDTSI